MKEKLPAPELPDWLAPMVPFTRYRVDVGGRRMHVMETGEGRPVLLVHGNPTWGFLYRKIARALSGEPIRLVMPDLVGLGFSDRPDHEDEHTLDNHVSWLARLVTELDEPDLGLVVQDWGGPIGVGALHEAGATLSSLVVLNTVLGPPKPGFKPTLFHRLARMPGVSDLLFRRLSFPQAALGMAQGDKLSIRGEVSRAYRFPLKRLGDDAPLALARMVPDSLEHASVPGLERVQSVIEGYRGPAAIVWGDRDPVLGRLKGRISRMLPQAVVTSTPAGHFLQEEVPFEIADAVRGVVRAASSRP